jgi:hypothetical protein
LTIETPSQIALQILNSVFFGLDLKELQTFRERVNAVTPDDIQRVSRVYLHPDRLTIVLVGDASSFVNQLPAAGFDKYDRISVADLDLASTDLRRKPVVANGGIRPAAYRTIVADNPRALVDKAIAAKGGLAKLRAIRTVKVEQSTTAQTQDGPVTFPSAVAIAYPDRFRLDVDAPGGKVTQVFDAGQYWLQDARGVREVSGEVRDSIRATLERDTISVLLKCAAGALSMRPAEAEAPLAGVMVSGDGLEPLTLFINRDTGFIEKVRYDTPAGAAEEEYSDYRNVEGVRVAFHMVLRRPKTMPIERDVVHIHFNVPLPAGLFTKPS